MASPMEDGNSGNIDNFKEIYKHFKRRDKPLSVKGVIDFSSLSDESVSEVEDYPLFIPESNKQFPGLKPVSEWKAYQIKNKPGFVVIKNPFEAGYQRYWIQRCLVDFPVKPNTTNVDAHMERPSHIWESCQTSTGPDLSKESLLMKLRWATLGYQYEWNTKEYFSDRLKIFPNDLAYLCNYIADAMGYPNFQSEAGIVNYYRMDSTLMGHTDVSELDKAAPLISFSFGQDCIFLIGGPTKATAPVPLFLHSGDISLMTGPARLSFHAVPRILHADLDYIDACFCSVHEKKMDDKISKKKNKGQSLIVDGRLTDKEIQSNGVHNESVELDTRTDHSKQAVDINVTKNDSSSDHEVDEDDPYSTTANKNHSCKLENKSCDSKGDNSEVQCDSVSMQGGDCELSDLKAIMDKVIGSTDWSPFQRYLDQSRINVNVRKVLIEGETLNHSPSVIPVKERNNDDLN